jgi:hypothetical protein
MRHVNSFGGNAGGLQKEALEEQQNSACFCTLNFAHLLAKTILNSRVYCFRSCWRGDMSTLEDIMRLLHGVLGRTDNSVSPSMLLDELFNLDSDLAMEFLLAVVDKYNIEFKNIDVYGRDFVEFKGFDCEDDFALLRNWSIQKLADYIDTSRT